MDNIDNVQFRRLDIGLLLVFEEVLRTGKLTSASQKLGLTQSAISHALSRLRDIFGDPLFLRRSQALVPTQRALALHEPIAQALGALRSAVIEAREFSPARIDRLFQIVAFDASIASLAPRLLARLAREAPKATLAVRSLSDAEARKAVREGRADLALGVFDSPEPGLAAISLGSERFAIVARKDHPLFLEGLTLETWLATDHIIVSAAGDLAGAIDPMLAARGLSRRTRAALPQFLAAFATVAAGDTTAAVPASLANAYAGPFGLAVYPPPIDLPTFELVILRRGLDAPDPALDWLVQLMVALRAERLASPRALG
jgi:DNA-binding transcriptional LysR family regulator